MTKYNNGKIYKIEPICDHDEGDIYIGSTTSKSLSERMAKHRYDYRKWKTDNKNKITSFNIFDKYGIENCNILLIENCNVISRDELNSREGYFIRSLSCVNRIINGRTDKEYREDNYDKKREKDKVYYEKNKEIINQKNKDNYVKNREQRMEQHKQYRLEHLEEEKQRAREYRQANKEACKERERLKYLKNKEKLSEKIICICGCIVTKNSLRHHEKSDKHIQLMESLSNSKDNVEILS